jgi:hypothetical protein
MRRSTRPHFISLRKFLLILLLALSSAGLAGPVSAGPNVWTSIGPEGGSIKTLAIDPKTPSTLNAGGDTVRVLQNSPGNSSTTTNASLIIGAVSDTVSLTPLDDPTPIGSWTGTTSRGYPLSFDIASDGTTWRNFKLKTNFSVGGCSGTTEITVFGPGPITHYRFNSSSGSFSFSGQFNTSTTASGVYAYMNDFISGCGYFTQFGTWTADTTTTPLSLKVYLPLILKDLAPPLPGSDRKR